MNLSPQFTSLASCLALLTTLAACDIDLGGGDDGNDSGVAGTGGDDADDDADPNADTAADPDDDPVGGTEGGGDLPDADESGGEEGGGDGLSCGEMWDCYLRCEDDACVEDCYFMGSPEGQAADDDLYQCQLDNDCYEVECLERDCFPELEGCFGDLGGGDEPPPEEPPAGSWLCFAEGAYQVCDETGSCYQYTATGAGIGANEPEAGFAAVSDCSGNMLNLIIINNINGSASEVIPCGVTTCSGS